jgi:hypothetical protein
MRKNSRFFIAFSKRIASFFCLEVSLEGAGFERCEELIGGFVVAHAATIAAI